MNSNVGEGGVGLGVDWLLDCFLIRNATINSQMDPTWERDREGAGEEGEGGNHIFTN